MRNFQNKAVLTFWLPACELIWIQHTLIFLWDIQFQLLSKSQGLCIFLCIQQIWLGMIAFRTELSTDYWRIERPWTWVKWPRHYRVHTWNSGMFSPWSHWLMGARIDILGNLHCQFETRPGNISRRTGCEHCRNKRVNGYVRLMKTDFFLQSLKMTFIRNFRRILVTINNNQQMHGCNCFESCLVKG